MREHIERLARLAGELDIDVPGDVDDLTQHVLGLLRRDAARLGSYMSVTASTPEPGPGGAKTWPVHVAALKLPVPADGVSVIVSEFSDGDPDHARAVEDARSQGCHDAILLDASGTVTGASASAVFLVHRDGRIVTIPAVEDDAREITTAAVIELCSREVGLAVDRRPVAASELAEAVEIFSVGTGTGVASVLTLDHWPVAGSTAGPITKTIQQTFAEVVRGLRPRYSSWLSPVFPTALAAGT